MKELQSSIQSSNDQLVEDHQQEFDRLTHKISNNGLDATQLCEKISKFQVAIPSWALGAGGTRFGRFSFGGESRNLEEKLEDIGLLHALTGCAGAVSLHIPWDIPRDIEAIRQKAASMNIVFDAVNSNTFQDQPNQQHSYKYGSLSNSTRAVREQAIQHNKEVIDLGNQLGSKSLTVWLADGSNFPGQTNFRSALQHAQDSLVEIYEHMPQDWSMFIEYKPYEPNFYHTVIQDWGTSLMLAEGCGERAYTLIDLGHHLPNTNIEHIVATLMHKGKLGGFHFNDSKYGDDDLTVGAIKPYQLFLIFNELVAGMQDPKSSNPNLAWMIDASHNIKDPLEDLLQSLDAILIAYAQALLVDQAQLEEARSSHDVVRCQELLQHAFRTDVRPLVRQARRLNDAALDPLHVYRSAGVRSSLIDVRGSDVQASGL